MQEDYIMNSNTFDPELDRPIYDEETDILITKDEAQRKYDTVIQKLKTAERRRLTDIKELLNALELRIGTDKPTPQEKYLLTKYGR
jgi:hypothetical protein